MAPPSEFTAPPVKSYKIGIIGGGISGLILTLALLKNQIPVTLFEAASAFGEIGAGVSFGPNASRAMKLISPSIYKAFQNCATRNQWEEKRDVWFDFRYGESCEGRRVVGEKIGELRCEGGQASVHRAHFLDELVDLLPDGLVRFAKRCVGYEEDGEGVVVKFLDGTTERFDAVVGCDGIKSKMRVQLLGERDPAARAVYSGKYAYRGLIPMDKARELLGDELAQNAQMYLGRHGHVLTFSIQKGKIMNMVGFVSSEEWTNPDWVIPTTKADMLKDFEGWGDSVKEILSLVEKPDIWALFNDPPAKTYYKGRVCLIGDAAHASTPHHGSGAGMAIEDAYILSNLLADVEDAKEIGATFKVFDTVRRPRTLRLVEASREGGQLWDLELDGDNPEALRKNFLSRMQWIWDHDLEMALAEAKGLLQRELATAV